MDAGPNLSPPIRDSRCKLLWAAAQTDEERLALVRATMERGGRHINVFVPAYAVWFLLDYTEQLKASNDSK